MPVASSDLALEVAVNVLKHSSERLTIINELAFAPGDKYHGHQLDLGFVPNIRGNNDLLVTLAEGWFGLGRQMNILILVTPTLPSSTVTTLPFSVKHVELGAQDRTIPLLV